MNTPKDNRTPSHEGDNSANQPAPTSPPPARHAQDGGCCACCGDYRNAVIIADVFAGILNLILIIGIATDRDREGQRQGAGFLADGGFIPGGGEWGPDEDEFYGLVRPYMILSIISLVMAVVSAWGAMVHNAFLVLVNAIWLPIAYIIGAAFVATYCGGHCDVWQNFATVPNKIGFGLLMLVFLWPHVGFVAKANGRNNESRANRGALANDAYAEEEYRCCFARTRSNARVHEDERAADPGTGGDRSEIDVEAPQPLSYQNKTSVAWGKKHALKVVVVVAAIFLILGLSVGLTQNSSKEVSLRVSECGRELKWHYSPKIAGCINDPDTEGYWLFDSRRECCLYHFGTAICTSHDTCTGVSGDHGPGRPDYDWTDYGSSEDGSEDVLLSDLDLCVQAACEVPPYEHIHSPATCEELTGLNGHSNMYWTNENFLCRTNERPCEATSSVLGMDLPNGMRLAFDTGEYDFGPAEMWHLRTNSHGITKTTPWSSPYRFYSEGRWNAASELAWNGDFNDYFFGSLECDIPQDENDFVFIVIDGVLVDSCPKSVAEECRACLCLDVGDASSDNGGADLECEQKACEVQPYEPHPPTTCEALMSQDDHTNSYYTNVNFLCRTNERPCEATSSVLDLDLEDGLTNYGLKHTEMTDGSQDFPVIQLPTNPTDLDLRDGMSILIMFDEDEERNEMFHAQFGSQVWHIRTNQEGDLRSGWSSPYRFYAEGRWFNVNDSQQDAPILGAFDSYLFGSLECLGPQADDEFVFIVIDGVLVDSCPKSVVEGCRACPKSVADECRFCNSREC